MKISTQKLSAAAITGAAYAALTILLAPISFGAVQFRVSEALCILPVFIPSTAWGLFAGCAIANLLSSFGPVDVIFGSLATLGAALSIARLGGGGARPLSTARASLVCLMPALWNAPVIGAVIAYMSGLPLFSAAFFITAGQIGLGELGVMFAVGLPLLHLLPRSAPFMALCGKVRG